MPPRVLATIAPPDPFPALVGEVAELRILGRIPPPAELREVVAAWPADVLCAQMADAVDAQLLKAAGPRLRCVSLYAAGYDNVDLAALDRHGVALGSVAGALTEATADLAMALLLAAARRLVEGDGQVRRGEFGGWAPDHLLGTEVSGAQLGIIGFGRIGQAMARRALGFSMRVVHAERAGASPAEDLRGRVTPVALDRLLEESDLVSLHVPLTAGTRHLIDEGALRRMRRHAVIVNTARGAVIDEAALVRALRDGWIAAAALDVYEHEPELSPGLAELPNVVLAPHIGSATRPTRTRMAELCARNALDALAGDTPRSCVNPAVWRRGSPVPLVAAT